MPNNNHKEASVGATIDNLRQKVIEKRVRLRWTRSELARELGVTPQYYYDWEAGVREYPDTDVNEWLTKMGGLEQKSRPFSRALMMRRRNSGDVIRTARREIMARLSALMLTVADDDMAQLLGFNVSTIIRWRAGDSVPKSGHRQKVLDALNELVAVAGAERLVAERLAEIVAEEGGPPEIHTDLESYLLDLEAEFEKYDADDLADDLEDGEAKKSDAIDLLAGMPLDILEQISLRIPVDFKIENGKILAGSRTFRLGNQELRMVWGAP